MFGSEPTPNIHELFIVNVSRFWSQLVLPFTLKIPLEMIKKTNLFLEFIRIVLEIELFDNIFPLDSLDIVEKFFSIGEHLGRIIKVDSNHIVTQRISNSIFGRIVNPFFNSHITILQRFKKPSWSFLEVIFSTIFQHPLTLSPTNILRNLFFWWFVNRVCSISRQKFILTLLTHVSAGSLHKYICTNSLLV